MKIPCKDPTDKKRVYIRYADDFLIGVNGTKEECEQIKVLLKDFLSDSLKLELSDERTKITHSSEYADFLGYDVRVRRTNKLKRQANGVIQRTLNGTVELQVPLREKMEHFVLDKGIARVGKKGRLEPKPNSTIFRNTNLGIVDHYNAQTRGICKYYQMASNFNKRGFFVYLYIDNVDAIPQRFYGVSEREKRLKANKCE